MELLRCLLPLAVSWRCRGWFEAADAGDLLGPERDAKQTRRVEFLTKKERVAPNRTG